MLRMILKSLFLHDDKYPIKIYLVISEIHDFIKISSGVGKMTNDTHVSDDIISRK